MVEWSLTGEIKGTDDMMALQTRRCARAYNLEAAITTPQVDAHEDCVDLTVPRFEASCLGGLTSYVRIKL